MQEVYSIFCIIVPTSAYLSPSTERLLLRQSLLLQSCGGHLLKPIDLGPERAVAGYPVPDNRDLNV